MSDTDEMIVMVEVERAAEAIQWLLDHGSMTDPQMIKATKANRNDWLNSKSIMDVGTVPFKLSDMDFLCDDMRVLFKLTFAA